MYRMQRFIPLAALVIAFTFLFTACDNDDSDKALLLLGLSKNMIVNDTGGNTGGDSGEVEGISDNENITVVNGKILVNVENGALAISGENVILTVLDNGIWVLAPGVTISLEDQNGSTVTGTVIVDPVTGNLSFIPDEPLDVNNLYTITVTVGDSVYTATVIIAVDNTDLPDSMFADVSVYSESGVYPVIDALVNGKSIFGWEFPPRFKIQLIDVETGSKVYLNFYGVYDVPAYSDLVFYQRWHDSGEPVKDYDWSWCGWIWVDEIDASIDGEIDYSFRRTYAEIRIIDGSGNDITATSAAKFEVVTQ